jgi:hypothetical protein
VWSARAKNGFAYLYAFASAGSGVVDPARGATTIAFRAARWVSPTELNPTIMFSSSDIALAMSAGTPRYDCDAAGRLIRTDIARASGHEDRLPIGVAGLPAGGYSVRVAQGPHAATTPLIVVR